MDNSGQKTTSENLSRAGIWSVLGNWGARILDLLLLVILSNFLSPADFGLAAQALVVLYVIDGVTALPIDQPILRIKRPVQSIYHTGFTLTLARGIAVSLLLAACAFPLAEFFREPDLTQVLWAISLIPLARSLRSPKISEKLRSFDFRAVSGIEFISRLVALICAVSALFFIQSHWVIIIGSLVAPVVASFQTYLISPYIPRLTLRHWNKFADVLGWNSVNQALLAFYWQIDFFILGRSTNNEIFGNYSQSRRVNELPEQSVSKPLLSPIFSAFATAQDASKRGRIWIKYSTLLLFIVGPFLVGISVMSHHAIYVLFGDDWTFAGSFLFALCLASLPGIPFAHLPQLAVSLYRTKVLVFRTAAQLVMLIMAIMLTVPIWGVHGAIVSKGAVNVFSAIIAMLLVKQLIGLPVVSQCLALVRTTASLCIMAASIWGMIEGFEIEPSGNRILLAIQSATVVGVSGILYFLSHFGLWALCGKPDALETNILQVLERMFKRVWPQKIRA